MIINLSKLDKIVIAVITIFTATGTIAKLYQYDWLCYAFFSLSLMIFISSIIQILRTTQKQIIAFGNVIAKNNKSVKGEMSLSENLPGKAQVVAPSQGPALPFILPPIEGLGQDYTFIQKKVEQAVQNKIYYHKGVSVVIPVYNRKAILEKTLAALTHQTYPADLIEIIIADDGSSDGVEEVIEKFKTLFDISHVKQRDEGWRASAIRNKGIKKAKYDYIILLDCDMLPAPEVAEEFMKWFHITDNVVLIGHRRFVNTDEVTSDHIMKDINKALSLPDIASDNDIVNPNGFSTPTEDWRIGLYEKTDFLKKETLPFRVLAAGLVGMPKKHIDDAGYLDESFVNWGGEDGEFGFRLYQNGLYFVPLMTAVGLHQEHPFPGSRKKHREKTIKLIEQKIPVNLYRKYKKGILYEIPKVSIYIPAYNAGKYIKQSVDSALRQTYTDLEICICDDGSTDNTVEVLEKSYSDHPRVRWLTIPHGGIGKASNTAVKMCRGLYIGQLDADDMLLPHAVETCVKYLDTHPDIGCVYGTYERVDESGKFIEPGYNWPKFSREILLNNMIVHHFRMFGKRDWSRTTGFNETYENAVDYDMYIKLSEVCKFHHINEVLYRYRINKQGTSMVKTRIQTENTHKVVKKILKKYGLDQSYEINPDPLNPRNVKFRKKVNKSDSELPT